MLKPIAAGLMCLGFVTLGVAISRGEDEDLIVIDGKLDATEVKGEEAGEGLPAGAPVPAQGELVEIKIGSDGGLKGPADSTTTGPDYGSELAPLSARVARLPRGPQVLDPQTRESLERMIPDLKQQILKLQSEGKQEEAQQKTQSLGAIASLLHGNPRVGAVFVQQRNYDPKQTMEEMKKLHMRLDVLIQQSSKLPDGAVDERKTLHQEIQNVKKRIAERHQLLTVPAPVGRQPPQYAPGQPPLPLGMAPPQFTQQPPGQPPQFGPGQPLPPGAPMTPGAPQPPGGIQFHGGGFGMGLASEAGALAQKAFALGQAATRLREAGLEDQARQMQEQADVFSAQAQMLQVQVQAQQAQGHGAAGFAGSGMPGPGGPPMELHRSIRELQEQIQQLRKEVGELRELLQRK